MSRPPSVGLCVRICTALLMVVPSSVLYLKLLLRVGEDGPVFDADWQPANNISAAAAPAHRVFMGLSRTLPQGGERVARRLPAVNEGPGRQDVRREDRG